MITINTAQELRDSIGLEMANEWIDRSDRRNRERFRKAGNRMRDGDVGASGELIPF